LIDCSLKDVIEIIIDGDILEVGQENDAIAELFEVRVTNIVPFLDVQGETLKIS
jgi:hypothetical protein